MDLRNTDAWLLAPIWTLRSVLSFPSPVGILAVLALWLAHAPMVRAQNDLPAADQLLSETLARLPREPVVVTGYLQPIRSDAAPKYHFRLNLSYGGTLSRATVRPKPSRSQSLSRHRR